MWCDDTTGGRRHCLGLGEWEVVGEKRHFISFGSANSTTSGNSSSLDWINKKMNKLNPIKD